MRACEVWATVLWMCLGLFVIVFSYKLRMGTLSNPGPGLMPFLLGLALEILEQALKKVTSDPEYVADMKSKNIYVKFVDGDTIMKSILPANIVILKEIVKADRLTK